jgi:hypothetical protein
VPPRKVKTPAAGGTKAARDPQKTNGPLIGLPKGLLGGLLLPGKVDHQGNDQAQDKPGPAKHVQGDPAGRQVLPHPQVRVLEDFLLFFKAYLIRQGGDVPQLPGGLFKGRPPVQPLGRKAGNPGFQVG